MAIDPNSPEAQEQAKQLADIQAKMAAIEAQQAQQQEERNKYASAYSDAKSGRDQDFAEGKQRGQELFGDNSLGRVDAGRRTETADLLARQKAMASGYTPEEQEALRSQNVQTIQGGTQANLRQLKSAQAQNGVHGATATNQQARTLLAGNQQLANSERDLFAKNADVSRASTQSYSDALNKAQGDETNRAQFNIGQTQREKYGQLTTEFGYASLGSADRAAVMQKIVGEQQAQAAANSSANQGGKK